MTMRRKKIIQVSLVGVATNILLATFKLVVGVVAGSVAIILDAVNNLTDVLSSVVTIIGTKLASKRPDPWHPYGHGRSEYIAAFLVGILILLTGIMALVESIPKIVTPELADYSLVTIVVVVAAIIIKLVLGLYVRKMGRRLNSSSLSASGVDALFDAALSMATLVGIIVTMVWRVSIDGVLGVIIALFIVRTSVEIMLEASGDILGRTADRALIQAIYETICSFAKVSGAYDLTLHNYGPAVLVGSVQIQVPDDMTAKELHKLSREITSRVYAKYKVDLTVGIFAENIDQPDKQAIKQKLLELLQEYPEVKQMHAFFVDEDDKVIAFDLVVDYKYREVKRLKRRVKAAMKTAFPEYKCLVVVDFDLENAAK